MSALPSYNVKHGGLMRCCLASLDEAMTDPAKNPPDEGDTLNCKYEAADKPPQMVFRNGAWQWSGK